MTKKARLKLYELVLRLYFDERMSFQVIADRLTDETGEKYNVTMVKRLLLSKEMHDMRDNERKLLAEIAYDASVSRLMEQVNSENEWVAQNASRDLASRYQTLVMPEEEKTMEIRISGMPELGVPDNNDLELTAHERAEAEKQ